MSNILGNIIGYIFLFFGICLFVLIVIAFGNIITKSYNPKHAIIIIGFLVALFLVNSLILGLNYGKLASSVEKFFTTENGTTNNSIKSSGVGF